ncbi:hypothetical protein DM02DRAFT_625690 [Periconia macrospinosa]|uniref:Putative gamma-glutamylcyclotransferase n=1 Tax=Periconia macrospinosa TaxID=97972 RepID=A0A2V1DZI8_9PLEO|nr:hypothetical protein DM02DRAFT_625690 [Periconia macrospinosa]
MSLPTRNPNEKAEPPSFTPHYMFFYGSLMDPDVLRTIANLPSPPTTKKGSIKGFTMKMWSVYPTLIPTTNSNNTEEVPTIPGVLWKVETEEQFQRLAAYETSAYTSCACAVVLEETGETVTDCRTFCWAGDVESSELRDGRFDLEWYQRHFKPAIFKRNSEVEEYIYEF